MSYIDFHVHTAASDGSMMPEELVREAKRIGLRAIAVTDHDTIDGIKEAVNAGAKLNLEVVPGIEITTDDENLEIEDVHVLGLFVDISSNSLKRLVNKCKSARVEQKKTMIKRLNELGYEVSLGEVRKLAGNASISRVHIAELLVKKRPEEFRTISEVFDKLIGNNKEGYVKRKKTISADEAIESIKSAGGISFLAHPFIYKEPSKLMEVFRKLGCDGIETLYPYDKQARDREVTSKEKQRLIKKARVYAKRFSLLETGGSDFHGYEHRTRLGEMKVPYEFYEKMKSFLKRL